MKVCVSAVAGGLDAQVDLRFGRCLYFVCVDSETMKFEGIPNTASGARACKRLFPDNLTSLRGVE